MILTLFPRSFDSVASIPLSARSRLSVVSAGGNASDFLSSARSWHSSDDDGYYGDPQVVNEKKWKSGCRGRKCLLSKSSSLSLI